MANKLKSVVVIFYCCLASSAVFASDLAVAEVAGQEILYQQIKVNPLNVVGFFEQKNNRKPTEQELSQLIKEKEKRKLIAEIQKIIREKAVNELGITISDSELDKEYELSIGRYQNQSAINSENKMMSKLVSALKERLEHPEREKEIYDKELSSLMRYEVWDSYKNRFKTKNDIEKLAESIPIVANDLKKSEKYSKEMLRELIVDRKIEEIVTKDVSASEGEAKQYYISHGGNGKDFLEEKDEVVKELLNNKKQIKLSEWWQEQYKKAKIEIRDDRFKDVMNFLVLPAKK